MIKECILYEKLDGKRVRCKACSHRCFIASGKKGICGVRKNVNGKLMLLVYGKFAGVHADPIEKKPFYHFMPGTKTFSLGTFGCNFKCSFCQNFDISQKREGVEKYGEEISPEKAVELALKTGCKSIAYTYNEPTIFIEYVKDCCGLAKKKGLKNVFVTNGYMTEEALDFLDGKIDAANIDLKSFNEEFYKKICGAEIKHVKDTIKRMHEKGIHVEVTTLLIPGENDSEKELEGIAKFLAGIDKSIPWHISRFFPMHKMLDKKPTPIESLERAYEIGKKYLKYVHLGNI